MIFIASAFRGISFFLYVEVFVTRVSHLTRHSTGNSTSNHQSSSINHQSSSYQSSIINHHHINLKKSNHINPGGTVLSQSFFNNIITILLIFNLINIE